MQLEFTRNVIPVNSDIAVVGAGPTGSFAALQAAKLGAQTIVCEARAHRRFEVPSHCTGHISLAGLKRLNLDLPRKVFENEIKSAVFYSPSGYRFSVRFDSAVTCVVDRALFDQHLCRKALEAGVQVLTGVRVDSFLTKNGTVKGVVLKKRGKTEKLISKVVIDAEGVTSTLLKRARLPTANSHMIISGVQAEVDRISNCQRDTVEVFLSRRNAPGLFAWIVPRRDGSAKIGLATENGNPRICLSRFISCNPITRQRLKGSKVSSLVYHPISLGGPISRTFHDGLLIVGDAASQVKPTTGGGVVMGLTCAEIAGRVAALAAHKGNSSANFLSKYEIQWKERIGFDMAVMKHLRHMINRLSDRQIDKLIALCARLRLDESLKLAMDVDHQGTSLIRLAKSPRILVTVLYFLAASLL